MYLSYNTNGLVHHRLDDALELLAEIGYRGVAVTLDHSTLNPFDPSFERNLQQTAILLGGLGMRSVVETGARYLLDPRRKHQPTLVSDPRRGQPVRIEFLCRAIDAAVALGSDCVSLWSGAVDDGVTRATAMERLVDSLERVLEYAERAGVPLAFEPEPGMLIDTMASYSELTQRLDSPALRLTLDVGHLHCLGETPIPPVIHQWRQRLMNVHIEDMRRGTHEHLMFGEGEIDFPPVLAALAEVGYSGGLHVELSRHSHEGVEAARRAQEFLVRARETAEKE